MAQAYYRVKHNILTNQHVRHKSFYNRPASTLPGVLKIFYIEIIN